MSFAAEKSSGKDNEIRLGYEDGWQDIVFLESLVIREGRQGYPDMVLADGEYVAGDSTDLLIHFNQTPILDQAENYTIGAETTVRTTEKIYRLGAGAGLFTGETDALAIVPQSGSMLAPGQSWGNFSMEFWFYPAVFDEGATILLWSGSRRVAGGIIPQEIRCSISGRTLLWEFTNIFLPPDQGESRIVVHGTSRMIPKKWHHHLIRHDSASGLLEYLTDGVPDAVTYSTDTGHEMGALFVPLIGQTNSGELSLGAGLNGIIDEMRFSRAFVEEPFVDTYPLRVGSAMTRVFDLGYSNSLLKRFDSLVDTPGDTGINFYYRIGESYRSLSEVTGEWRSFTPGDALRVETRGRYLQVFLELFPDGGGKLSPSISTLSIFYEPDLPPHPPGWVAAEPGSGEITIRWNSSMDSDVAGYLLYYGERPGQYFGIESATGPSPVDVGNVTSMSLQGLENGKLYYIAIVSYDSSEPPHQSDFSQEIAARPSTIYDGR
ncbi:MAG: hypothetical protein CMN78_05965 [Spirochaetales bacterium]|nr:hypothetical protein [Spirochaetales bacterium]